MNAVRLTDVVTALIISLALVFGSLATQWGIGFGLDDEGFLWYGVQRLIEGDIPLKDFQSYEPGRYFWCWATSRLFGDGILGLRAGIALFQVVGLACGLLCLRRLTSSVWGLFAAGLLLLLWMYPRHKLFEPAIAMGAVFVGTLLIESPSGFRYFLAGLFVGIAALFGRNHGIYCLAGLGGVALFLSWRNGIKSSKGPFLSFALGIALGLAPFAVMVFLFPGFGAALAESLFSHVATGNVNLSLPVPWPWVIESGTVKGEAGIRLLAQGLLLVAIPLFYLAVLLKTFPFRHMGMERMAPVISCAFVGIPYLHHAFARADLSHLAQAIHPFLIGVLCLLAAARNRISRIGAWVLVAVVSALSMGSIGTVVPCYEKWKAKSSPYARVRIQGDSLWVPGTTAKTIEGLFSLERNYFSLGGEIMAAPHLPGAYSLLGRKSPLRQTYFFFPETEEHQRTMITEMDEKNVRWVILGEGTLDGREDLRFRNTHPLVWRHIMDAFEPVPGETLPGGYKLHKRRA